MNKQRHWGWLLIGAVLWAVWPTTTQAQAQISAPVSVPSATTKNKVRVIITLKNVLGFERELMHPRQIDARRVQNGRNVRTYVQNNKSLLKVVHRELTIVPMVVATVSSGDLAQLAQSPQVASINEDKLSSPDLAESTDLIDSRAVNEGGYGGSGQMVAVLDTGVDKNHEFLSGQVYGEACFSTNDTDFNADSLCPNDTEYETGPGKADPCATLCDHGTHVAGIVAGKRICIDCGTANQVMMSGVAPDAKIMAVQVFSQFTDDANADTCNDSNRPSPCILSFDSDQIAALQWLVAFKPVWQSNLVSVNMSLGGGKTNAPCDVNNAAHAAAINQLRVLGVATVIASGNSSFSNGIGYPACVSTAITVGSTRTRTSNTNEPPDTYNLANVDLVSSFSNAPTVAANAANASGDRLLDLLAPGSAIYSAIDTGTNAYASYNGTSMATPHVAGAWAVIKGINPNMSVTNVLTLLRNTGRSVTDTRNNLIVPRINVGNAVVALRNGNADTQISSYGVNFGRVTRNQTVYLNVGIQTALDSHQPLATNMTGDSEFFLHSSTCLANLYYRPSCVLTIGFTPTSTFDLPIYTGQLNITITTAGVPRTYNVGLYGRSQPITPDIGQTQTVVALSRTPTRTRTPVPTIAHPVWTLIVGATQTVQSFNFVRTAIALNATQFVLNDRLTATAERIGGTPSRTRTSSATTTASATPVPIIRTVNAAQTQTQSVRNQATATQRAVLTATAVALANDKLTATRERTLGLATRTKTSSPTRTASLTRTNTGTATASTTKTATATALTLIESTSVAMSNQIQRLIALPSESGYAVLTQGTSVITPALTLLDTTLSSLAQVDLPGEKASALTDVDERPGLLYVGGRLFKDAMYIQSYQLVAQAPVAGGIRLELGNGEPTAMYATGDRLYVAVRYLPLAGGAERFEVRSYDISDPAVIAPLAGFVATVPGPVNSLVGVPLSDMVIAAGKRTGATTGFITSLWPQAAQLKVAATVPWPREIVSAVVRSHVAALVPQHTLFVLDRQDIVALALSNTTGAITATPLNKVAQIGDFVTLDPTHSQLLVGRYNATVPTSIETSLHVYDVFPPAGLRLRGVTTAITGDGMVRGIAADFGQIIVAAGTSLAQLSAYGLLMPTRTPNDTVTPSTTKTASRTWTATRTRTSTGTATTTPTMAPSTNRLEAGTNHTCVINYYDEVYCWGDAAYGQLGNNQATPQPLPVAVSTGALSGVRQIDSGWNHTCARNMDKTIACWGENSYGALSNQSTTNLLEPVLSTTVSDTVQVAVGWHHACAINSARSVLCWGMGTSGQLGNGLNTTSTTPELVFGVVDVRQIALGAMHGCAVTGAKWLYCWGGNTYGQLGTGDTSAELKAYPIMADVSKVATYENTTCMIHSVTKSVWCVGDNQYGQAGSATGYNTLAFTQINTMVGTVAKPLSNVVDIEAGMNHVCAIDSSGIMYCWGDNFYGQSGASSIAPHLAVKVAGLSALGAPKVVDMALGENHSCALLANNQVKCWGRNDYGQLGNTTTVDSATPVLVSGLYTMLPTYTPTRTP